MAMDASGLVPTANHRFHYGMRCAYITFCVMTMLNAHIQRDESQMVVNGYQTQVLRGRWWGD
ncbi:hypothetical protein GGP41_009984 [Bipolaris sorokiniana]|uniref:Uncharacterized protein n=1 Tax=Cochliobolus sativus TaxID=45130 RepID=A0A8H6DV01_COCSA|nr:hypothetical protein GGP41_009984 [Bipolaris sorokiniana]